jgi:hypothetical protein
MDGEMKCNVDVAIFQELNPLVCAFFIKAKTMWFEDTPPASGGDWFEMWLGAMEASIISIELDCKLTAPNLVAYAIELKIFVQI